MKFKKAVLVEIEESALDQEYWQKIDELVDNKVFIERKDPNLTKELADCDCLLLGFQIEVGKDLMDAAPNLKYIGVLATAYGTIDIEYAAKKKIPVSNLAGYSTDAVAEFTIAILLYEIRQLQQGMIRANASNYDFGGMSARELKGSDFGVIGLGNIGGRVAELAAGFGAKVSYWSRNKKDVPFTYKDLDKLITESDYLSINIAQTPETEKLLNANNIPLVPAGAVVISTVPPEVVDTNALAARLAKKDITYISDHADEMSKQDLDKIKEFKNCILLPAIGFITIEARKNKQEIFVANIKAALNGQPINTVG